jgi:hypothetical protein
LKNIECRDAVLVWDKIELVRDEKGKPVTRWDGESMKKSPITGDMVPDESRRVTQDSYVNPRKAKWPSAEFIVGNPPYLGTSRMRSMFGDGYTEALRGAYPELPESIDFVMYWWDQAAHRIRTGPTRRAGLITTTSLTQTFNRKVLQLHMEAEDKVSLVFGVADHPWVSSKYGVTKGGAEVRIAMTVIEKGSRPGVLAKNIHEEYEAVNGEVRVDLALSQGIIHPDLTIGADIASARPLQETSHIGTRGVSLHGAGFIVTTEQAYKLGLSQVPGIERHIRAYRNGQDFTGISRDVSVIDLFGLREDEVKHRFPEIYQWILERVKPERTARADAGKDSEGYAKNWWLFGKPRPELRPALAGLKRFIATVESSRRRFFLFVDGRILPDNMLVVMALDDAFFLGVLSSSIHVSWALAAGGRLGVRHDPRYNKTRCFDPFPFPDCSTKQKALIRTLGEALDAHRKRQQALFPKLTLTNLYRILEMVRSGEPLTDKDRVLHEQGLVSVLKQIHDDLDAAVFDAYGWPRDLTGEQILEKLVALNASRAEEERTGHVRWLRPEFQNPTGARKPENLTLVGTEATDAAEESDDATAAPAATVAAWPKRPGERIAAIRDLVVASKRLWHTAEVTAAFKGAKKKDVADLLDSLAGIGVLVAYGETEKELRWGLPTRTGVS